MKRIIYKLVAVVITAAFVLTPQSVYAAKLSLSAGGMPFGVKLYTDGALVALLEDVPTKLGVLCPARDAGLLPKDMIIEVDGKHVTCASDIASAVAQSGGRSLTFAVRRGGETLNFTLTPALSSADGAYKAGMWLRDSTSGIGTVTYIDCETGEFGGLGHGICDADTGELLPMLRGVVYEARINGIKRGLPAAPGELRGSFGAAKLGALIENSACGVFGVLSERSELTGEPIELGGRESLHEGAASMICTLDDTGAHEYTIELSAIDRSALSSKCFTVTVTDKALLEKTGGIVQGMSGSPIIQDGKLVGAVTHVCVNL